MMLDLRNLRCAIAAAETGSFRRAAEILGLSQSTLSRRIQHLERRIGFSLFRRSRTGVLPTTAGAAFLESAAAGAEQLDIAARYAVAIERGQVGKLRVGIASSHTGGLFGDVLRKFRDSFPSINIELIEDASRNTIHNVAVGALDVAFLIDIGCNSVCESRVLWREAIFAALGRTHQFFAHEFIRWEDIYNDTIILRKAEQGSDLQHQILSRLMKAGHRLKVDIQDISEASIFDLVASGCGITFINESSARRIDGLNFLPLVGESEALVASAVWRADNSNPAVSRLIAIAIATGQTRGNA